MMETNAFFPWFATPIKGDERVKLIDEFEKEIQLEKEKRAEEENKLIKELDD